MPIGFHLGEALNFSEAQIAQFRAVAEDNGLRDFSQFPIAPTPPLTTQRNELFGIAPLPVPVVIPRVTGVLPSAPTPPPVAPPVPVPVAPVSNVSFTTAASVVDDRTLSFTNAPSTTPAPVFNFAAANELASNIETQTGVNKAVLIGGGALLSLAIIMKVLR